MAEGELYSNERLKDLLGKIDPQIRGKEQIAGIKGLTDEANRVRQVLASVKKQR